MNINQNQNYIYNKLIPIIAYLYVSIPFIIFTIGWIKWYFSIVILSVIFFSLYKIIKYDDPIWSPTITKTNFLKIIIILLAIIACVLLSGIGKLAWQNFDHPVRNTIFRILVEDKWPLINYEWNSNGSALIYYIGFWLPSAAVAKFTNISIGNYFQIVWAVLGVFITYMLICSWLKKLRIWPLFIFLFFSGLDIIGYLLKAYINGMGVGLTTHLEWWSGYFQYTSIIAQLFWVFNQCIPAWCITLLIFVQKRSGNLVFLLSLSMLSSVLPFIGLLPIVLFFSFQKCNINLSDISRLKIYNTIKRVIKELFTFQNVVGGGTIGIITFLYFKGNAASQFINFVNIFDGAIFVTYYLFIYLEVGVYLLYIYKYQKNNGLYYVIVTFLCVIPLIMVGTSADFCMRVSIPSIVILILLIIDTIQKSFLVKDKKTIIILTTILLLGAITPIFEINRSVYNTYVSLRNNGTVQNLEATKKEVYEDYNISGVKYSGEVKNNLFFEVLSK